MKTRSKLGTSGRAIDRTAVTAPAAQRPFSLRTHAPAGLLLVGLLALTMLFLAAAPQAHATTAKYVVCVRTPSITVTAPMAGAIWLTGGRYSIGWSASPAPSDGTFSLWLVSSSSIEYRINPAATPLRAIGSLHYTYGWKVKAPAAAGYRVCVKYSNAAGALVSRSYSSGTVTVTAP
jgi:hypothetical protein